MYELDQKKYSTFKDFLFSKRTDFKTPTPYVLLVILAAILGIPARIVIFLTNSININNDMEIAMISLGVNLAFLIFALLLFIIDNRLSSDYSLKQIDPIKAVEHEIPITPEEFKRANTLAYKFKNFFLAFIGTSAILYGILIVNVFIDKHEKSYIQSPSSDVLNQFKGNIQRSIILSQRVISATDSNRLLEDSTRANLLESKNILGLSYNSIFHNNLKKEAMEFLVILFNNVGIVLMYACFIILFSLSTEQEQHRLRVQLLLPIFVLSSITIIHFIWRLLAIETNPIYIHRSFRILSGLGNAVIMAMFFGKFNSRHFGVSNWLLFILFIYAIAQTLFCMFDYIVVGSKYLIMDITMIICFIGKCVLIYYCYWLLLTRRLFFYFLVYPHETQKILKKWEVFAKEEKRD